MKTMKFFLMILLFFMMLYENGNTQWLLKINGLKTDYHYSPAVAAYEDKTALVGFFSAPKNYIYKTTNGGDFWFELPWEYGSPISISILNNNKIWVATSAAEIYVTNNGGMNWELQFADTSKTKFFNYIKMFDENNGIAMGDAPSNDKPMLILRTTDGGINWISVNDSFFIGGYSRNDRKIISFVSSATGYLYPSISGQVQNKLFKTTDAGKTWSSFLLSSPPVWVLKFFDENIGFVATFNFFNPPVLMRTKDGGIIWEVINPPSQEIPRDIEFVPNNPNKIWLTDYNKLFFSSDMGNTWVEQFVSDTNLKATSIVFGDSLNGWLFCDEGKVYKTSNGDRVTSQNNHQIVKPSTYSLHQNYPNPFNSKTKIRFRIASTELNSTKGDVITTLKVYDLLGREIATLVNEPKQAGEYEVEFDADKYGLTSGVYLYELRSGSFKSVKKFVLMK